MGERKRLEGEIKKAFPAAYEMYEKYKEELRREGKTMFVDADGDCEVW